MISCVRRCTVVALALTLSLGSALAQSNADRAPAAQRADARFKADILVVVAHPDDESAVSAYLAKAVFDEGRRVAVVYTTSGEGGRNAMGIERGPSMGAVRQIEAVRALHTLGIDEEWFLDGKDTATQNVLLSLSTWPHGDVLEGVVRAIRLTRPEVVMTWLPRNVAGENHGDHQAASVIATEAFDCAGDPTVFAGQLAPARLRFPPENLDPWQPKKLYFFSDAFDPSFMNGKGPQYDRMVISTTKHVPYAYFAIKSASAHLSQFGGQFPQPLLDALAKDDVDAVMKMDAARRPSTDPRPTRLMLGKSLVGGAVTDDVMANVGSAAIAFVPQTPFVPDRPTGVTVALDGSWSFYPQFWRAHGLDRVLAIDPADVSVRTASELHVPIVLRNATASSVEVTLVRATALPAGWVEQPMPQVYPLGAGETYRIDAVLTSPPAEAQTPLSLTYEARTGTGVVGSVTLRVIVRNGTMPQ